MDASNGLSVDGKFVAATTVAPPPGVRPMAQPVFSQAVGGPLGLQGIPGLRPAQLNPATAAAAAAAAAAAGLPIFQAQTGQGQALSTLGRRSSVERAKGASQASSGRKQCNCKNSRCLKLYCECFASGRYCSDCNCLQCCNNRENESTRQGAVEAILERNPNAFRPKIQAQEQAAVAAPTTVMNAGAPGRHLKGCNCKKSSCLKKYCECFQAGIYCSENCKCVDCKNFEESGAAALAGTGPQAAGGGGGAGAKRVRYSSAPPASANNGGIPASGPGLAAGSLAAIRPGLLPPGLTALLQQQQQQQQQGFGGGGALGLPPGLQAAMVAPLLSGGPGASGAGRSGGAGSGMVGGSAAGASGPGGLQSLPHALSMALAAAVAAVPAGPGAPQQLMPLLAAPSPPPAGQAHGQQAAGLAAVQPMRSSLYEVVNGMVKRNVIEELCRLLWLVADDEGLPVKASEAPASSCRDASAGTTTAAVDEHGDAQERSLVRTGVVVTHLPGADRASVPNGGIGGMASTGGSSGSVLPSGQAAGIEGAQAGTAGTGRAAAAEANGEEAGADGAGGEGRLRIGHEVQPEFGARQWSTAVAMPADSGAGPSSSNRSTGGAAGGDGEPRGGQHAAAPPGLEEQQLQSGASGARAGGPAGGAAPQQGTPPPGHLAPPTATRRPGPLYGRKERVVLEEFLSILNKIGDTAAKKLAQQQAQQQQQQQVQQQQLQPPLVLPPHLVGPPVGGQQAMGPLQAQLQPVLLPAPVGGAIAALPQPTLSSSSSQPSGLAQGQPSGQTVGFPGALQNQATGMLAVASGSSAQATTSSAGMVQQQQQHGLIPVIAAPTSTSDGVPIIRPPLPAGGGLGSSGPAGPQLQLQPPLVQPAAAPGLQALPAPHMQQHMQGGVPVILAPPRSGAASQPTSLPAAHPHVQSSSEPQHYMQQPHEPQLQGLPPALGEQQPHGLSLCPTPFLPYSTTSLASDPGFSMGGIPPPQQQQQQHDTSALHQQPFILQQPPHALLTLPQEVQGLGLSGCPDGALQPSSFAAQQQLAIGGELLSSANDAAAALAGALADGGVAGGLLAGGTKGPAPTTDRHGLQV